METPAVETTRLSCRYGRHEAVREASFAVQPGTICALLGPNGAGKTTIIRALMNILRPTTGSTRVLGVDSCALDPATLAAIGYVSENQALPDWMTVDELLAFCRPFYPSWDDALCRRLMADFQLDGRGRISRLSRGMRVKAALVSALAYRPRLLVLDEPFSGLDPVVRDDLVHGVLERAGEGEWSVLVSSHDLNELETLADAVVFLDAGRVVITETLDQLQARFRQVELTVDEPSALSDVVRRAPDGGWIGASVAGRIVRFVHTRFTEEDGRRRILERFPGATAEIRPMTLREIFVALVREARAVASEALR